MKIPRLAFIMGGIGEDLVTGAVEHNVTNKKSISYGFVKWAVVAACFIMICATSIGISIGSNKESPSATGVADAAPMIYANDSLYRQSTSQTSYADLKEEFIYLGEVEKNIINEQGYSDGVPKANFQANHSIVGAKIYKYGEDIVVLINGRYWLYERYDNPTQ